ncbi:MAG: SDR family oxidoreductase [Firmicutes bacterium]|nr:SDR family oxidoreductase [Bacillota bacterium]
MTKLPLIATGNLTRTSLSGQVAVVTGAGGGIGFEAARALVWLGARVVVAEVSLAGEAAAVQINGEFGSDSAIFMRTDVGDERSVKRMAAKVQKMWGQIDIVINNATTAPLGAVNTVPIATWDASYRVNLRGPVLLAKEFLPAMIQRGYGVFVCVGSEGLAYMGAYETLKAAQQHLSRTLDAELEETNVSSFTIGPGMVPTSTAVAGVRQLADFYGKTMAEMDALTKDHQLSVEAAGAGFAAAVVLAQQFRGQEIGVKQALLAAAIPFEETAVQDGDQSFTVENSQQALQLCRQVRATLCEQSDGWQQRSIFERQWMLRDFKKHAGMPVEQWLDALAHLEQSLASDDFTAVQKQQLAVGKLAHYYAHLQDLSKGYIKDPIKLEESLYFIRSWQVEAEKLADLLA